MKKNEIIWSEINRTPKVLSPDTNFPKIDKNQKPWSVILYNIKKIVGSIIDRM